MKNFIAFSRGSSEEEFELTINVSDGESTCATAMYCTNPSLENLYQECKAAVPFGRTVDFQFGRFGPEFAGGACSVRMQPLQHHIFLTVKLEGKYFRFGEYLVGPQSHLYLRTEYVLVDNFVAELRTFIDGSSEVAMLEALAR